MAEFLSSNCQLCFLWLVGLAFSTAYRFNELLFMGKRFANWQPIPTTLQGEENRLSQVLAVYECNYQPCHPIHFQILQFFYRRVLPTLPLP